MDTKNLCVALGCTVLTLNFGDAHGCLHTCVEIAQINKIAIIGTQTNDAVQRLAQIMNQKEGRKTALLELAMKFKETIMSALVLSTQNTNPNCINAMDLMCDIINKACKECGTPEEKDTTQCLMNCLVNITKENIQENIKKCKELSYLFDECNKKRTGTKQEN